MRDRHRLGVLPMLGVLLLAGVCARAQAPRLAGPLLEELQRVGLDASSSYRVNDVFLRRDAVRLHLQHGTLVFLEPVAGHITGAVFEGVGEALVVPPNQEERQQLAKFTGSPLLAEAFASAYLRFTDDTYAELLAQIRAGRGRPSHSPEVAERWQPLVAPMNRMHSVRILLDFVQSPPRPYFYASVSGQRLGSFDVIVDARRREQVFLGQLRGEKERRYYDAWCSFARREPGPEAIANVSVYRIDTSVNPDRTLEAEADLEVEVSPPGGQMLIFHLARSLEVVEVVELEASAEAETARQLEFIQDIVPGDEEARLRGSDYVLVVLPPASSGAANAAAERRRLRFRYRGSIIGEAGAGVFYLEARDTWYPSLGQSAPARYELHFRYPSSLELVVAGEGRDFREEGPWKEGTWRMEVPLPLAGFNLGNFERRDFGEGPMRVSVYSNRQVEPRLARALRLALEAPLPTPAPPRSPPPQFEGRAPVFEVERVGRDVSESLSYFTRLFGPVPYGPLQVSPLPGRLAQGYPGLLYLSTLSYLSESDLARLGLNEQAREHLSQLMPAHETAHQWWGNWLWSLDYRDQWLGEALASYSALLFWEGARGDPAVRGRWLERYRANLLALDERGRTVAATGALSLGPRLNSSQSPAGYVSLAYNKGPWVIHMLRELFRNPETSSDELFFGVLRELVARGGERPLTTEEFQQRLEAVLPDYADVEKSRRLDWFFQQWVHDTGIPRYRLRWAVAGNERDGWQVEGTIEQEEVSDLFTMPVPVYARVGDELRPLGRVVVTGEAAAFRFSISFQPDEVVLDPFHTVLFVLEGEAAGQPESR